VLVVLLAPAVYPKLRLLLVERERDGDVIVLIRAVAAARCCKYVCVIEKNINSLPITERAFNFYISLFLVTVLPAS